jgi:translation initiation factor IF-2
MSNKVRVYDLAKELNLETRDILAVCEKLSIPVKSHSSSMPEADAELIRTNALHSGSEKNSEKISERNGSGKNGSEKAEKLDKSEKKSATAIAKPATTKPEIKVESKEADNGKSKQQILTVIKPPAISLSSKPSPASTANEPNLGGAQIATGIVTGTANSANPSIMSKPPAKPDVKAETLIAPQTLAQKPVHQEPLPTAAITEVKIEPKQEAKLAAKPLSSNSAETTEAAKTAAQTAAKIKATEPKPETKLEAKPELKLDLPPKFELDSTETEPTLELKAPEPKAIEPKVKVSPKSDVRPEVLKSPKAPLRPTAKPQTIVNVSAAAKVSAPIKPEIVKPETKLESKAEIISESVVEIRAGAPKPVLEKPKAPNRVVGIAPDMKAKPAPPSNKPRPVKDAVLLDRGITAPTETPHVLRAPTPPTPRTLIAAPERRDRTVDRSADATATPDPNSPDLLVLKDRPLQPRIGKKKTKKEEDDQDVLEVKEKASRLKPKRYLQVVDEDDEDIILDEDGLEDTSVADLNLSTARPSARPKARLAKPATPVSAAAPGKAKRGSFRDRRNAQAEVVVEKPTKIVLRDSIKVHELATELMLPETDIIRVLFMKGMMASINQTLDIPTASMVAAELGYEVELGQNEAPARKVTEMLDLKDMDNLQRRPPVVTIMGHVDHGKTTLLDHIRQSKVAQGEAGGITQHIGAYHVNVQHGGQSQQIVFLDTPGHQAFTAMRARGTRVTDVAILVVAADDGVQPQTIEAISHAKAAKVPIIVAINKVDKYEAQPDRIRQELTEYGLLDEAWGGDTVMVPVSALTGANIDTLLEMILLVTEVEDLSANPNRPAKGTVIEANLDKARGPVATFLVQNGTLRVGDVFVAGSVLGKVRAMLDDQGKRVEAATPSFAVEVLGISEVPAAGDEFEVFTDERQARTIAAERAILQRQSRLQQSMASRRISLATVSAKIQEGDLKELNLILKADVQGSIEAILNALGQLPQGEVQVRVLLAAPGEITENDIELAAASEAIVVSFNTSMATGARQSADQLGIDVRDYSIIYKLLEDVQGAMEGMLEPELVEEPLGQAEVRAVFTVGKGEVAGCYVLSGKLVRNCRVRIKRGKEIVHESALDSLKRMKEDTKEVATGFECGVGLPKFNDWQQGDLIDAFRMVTKRRTLATV